MPHTILPTSSHSSYVASDNVDVLNIEFIRRPTDEGSLMRITYGDDDDVGMGIGVDLWGI